MGIQRIDRYQEPIAQVRCVGPKQTPIQRSDLGVLKGIQLQRQQR